MTVVEPADLAAAVRSEFESGAASYAGALSVMEPQTFYTERRASQTASARQQRAS